jgi:hypothetical protein
VILPTEPDRGERCRYEFLERVGDARSNNEVVGLAALKHSPHRIDVVGSPAPIAADREVAEGKPILVRMRDRLTLPLGWSDSIGYPLDLPIAYLDSIPLDFDCRLWSSASISRETMSGIAVVAFQPRTRWALAGFPALM